jgi:hypothetical protein
MKPGIARLKSVVAKKLGIMVFRETLDLAIDEDYLGSIFRRCRNERRYTPETAKKYVDGVSALPHSRRFGKRINCRTHVGLASSTLVDEMVWKVTPSPVLERNDVTTKPNNHTGCQDHERENV